VPTRDAAADVGRDVSRDAGLDVFREDGRDTEFSRDAGRSGERSRRVPKALKASASSLRALRDERRRASASRAPPRFIADEVASRAFSLSLNNASLRSWASPRRVRPQTRTCIDHRRSSGSAPRASSS